MNFNYLRTNDVTEITSRNMPNLIPREDCKVYLRVDCYAPVIRNKYLIYFKVFAETSLLDAC